MQTYCRHGKGLCIKIKALSELPFKKSMACCRNRHLWERNSYGCADGSCYSQGAYYQLQLGKLPG